MRARLLAGFLLGASLFAAPPELREVVDRFDRAQAQVQTFRAPFTLTIRRALLRTPTVTRGTVYLQGRDLAHFEFDPPEDLVLHLTPKALTSYSPQARRGQRLKIGVIRNTSRRFLGLGQRLSELSDFFKATVAEGGEVPGTWRVDLKPRALAMKRRFEAIQIWVDRASWLPRQVVWVERGGDRWELELGDAALNAPIPASVTGFKVPAGIPLKAEFDFFGTRKK